MTKCKSCGVSVDKALSHCPLCHRKFDTQTNNIISEWYPTYEVGNGELNSKKYRSLINKTVWFISILACCALSFINAFVTKEPIWCHIVIIPIIYVAFTITHTICSRAHLGLKILFQVVAISGLLIAVDVQSGFQRWSLNYVFPFLIMAATFLTSIIMAIRKTHLGELVEFIVALILLSLFPIHLYIYQVTNIIWPALLAEIFSIITIIAFVTFSKNEFLGEIKSRFHF